MPINDDPQDDSSATNEYDPSTMGDVLSQDEYNNSPAWFKERMGKMARQKNEAVQQSAAFRSELDQMRGQIQEIRNTPQPDRQELAEEKPFLQRASETELKNAAVRIMGLQDLARDPDATPEERAQAKESLNAVGSPAEVLFNIQQEISDRKANKAAGSVRDEITQRTRATDARNALVNRLFTDFGQDAINKNSPLSKAAFAKIRGWTQEHGITADQVNDFMTHKAFQEAATELRAGAPGNRGADPRTSPVLGSNVSRQQDGNDDLAVLERRGQQGDWKARKIVAAKKLERWLEASGLKGD
jgi:hypothetical protein